MKLLFQLFIYMCVLGYDIKCIMTLLPPPPPKKGAMKATALEHCFLNRFCKYQFLRSSDKFRKQTRTLTDLLYLIHISISKNPALKNLLFLLSLHFPIYIWPKTHHYFFTPLFINAFRTSILWYAFGQKHSSRWKRRHNEYKLQKADF